MSKQHAMMVLALMACVQAAPATAPDPQVSDYFWGTSLQVPSERREKLFVPSDDLANFTFFDGVKDVRDAKGILAFQLEGQKATLGWGNYMGRQPIQEIVDLWKEHNEVFIKVKQSGGESTWSLRYWCNGKRQGDPVPPVSLTGNEAVELKVSDGPKLVPVPDGLEITIQGEAGTRFEIEYVKIVQPIQQGYCRKEFTLPRGKIWRAIADVGGPPDFCPGYVNLIKTSFFINGREVERRGGRWIYAVTSVDITPYLKAGKNCLGFYGYRVGPYHPLILLQAKIIMTSGEVLTWTTDGSWRYAPEAPEGWNEAGFNDTAWQPLDKKTGGYGSYIHMSRTPCYKGRLVVRHPAKKDLFYVQGKNVLLDVHIPAGLASRSPSLTYVFGKADAEGRTTPIEEATVSDFTRQGDSLVYRVDAGQHPSGVYTIGLTLNGADGVIEARPREPLLVLRKLALTQVKGKDYFEGLDVELEDTIDFTDPDDPHPWIEGTEYREPSLIDTPTVVARNGLVYRETTPGRGAFFSYRFEFKHPGSFYVCEVEYPDDARRTTEVSLSTKTEKVWSNSQAGVGAETGGRYFLTGKMRKLRWIHVADPGVHSVDLTSAWPGMKAAARYFKIYRVKGDLVSVDAGAERLFGIHTERCYFTSGIGMNFGIGYPKSRKPKSEEEKKAEAAVTRIESAIKDLLWMQETSERYTQYLKFCGQNTHIMGCLQYTEYNTPFMRPFEVETSRIPPDLKTVLANTFDLNGIRFYAGVEWSQFTDLSTFANDAQVAKGADTIYMMDGQGAQYPGGSTTVQNWLHPKAVKAFRRLMLELADKFGDLPRFRGVHFQLGPSDGVGYWPPAFARGNNYEAPFVRSYDDAGFARFEADTGIDLPIDDLDPNRFEKRAGLVANPSFRSTFRDWRCRMLQDFLGNALDALREKREDLEFMSVLEIEEAPFFKTLKKSDRPFKDFLKDFAVDPCLAAGTDGLWLGRWTISWRVGRGDSQNQNPYFWIPRTDPDYISVFERDAYRYVLCRTSWDESALYTRPTERADLTELVESDWIMNGYRLRLLPQPGSYNAREAMIQALITAEPDALMSGFTDLNINVGHEQVLRELARVYTRLPREKFDTVLDTGLESNLAIRKLSRGGVTYVYVVNPGFWPIAGALSLRTTAEIRDLVTDQGVTVSRKGRTTELPVTLDPFGVAAYKIDARRLSVESFRTDKVASEYTAFMESIIERVDSLLSNEAVRIVLPLDDRHFMENTIASARAALEQRRYALAWARVSHWRFWSFWKDFLEQAARGLALLPDHITTLPRSDPNEIPTLSVHPASEPIIPDGKLNEAAWQNAAFSAGFVNREGLPTLAETGVKAVYDSRNLYLAFVCADRDPSALRGEANAEQNFRWAGATADDVLDIFVQPDDTKPVYYQLAFTPSGLHFDQRVIGGDKDYAYSPDWQTGVSTAETYWTAEVVLPYKAFGASAGPNTNWRINFHRVFRGSLVDSSSWSEPGRSWHNPERFGHLVFESS